MNVRHIGSRGSDLALWQSRTVLAALRPARPRRPGTRTSRSITTRGDLDQSPLPRRAASRRASSREELEVALLERRIDLVVHSLKDLPTAEPQGLSNRTILPRATPADWLLIRREFHAPREDGLLPLKAGTRVGASSLRRGALLGRFAPQAESVPLRGNVPTRLRRLAEGAGRRCHRPRGRGACRDSRSICRHSSSSSLPPEWWIPAPGQGALAAQCRAGDSEIEAQIALLADAGLCRCDALGTRVPARHRRRLLHAFRLLCGRQSRPSGYCHRASAGRRTASNYRQILNPRGNRNVTHSSAEPSPAASPSTLSDAAAQARSAELYSRAEALIPAGVSSPVRAFRKVGGTPVFFREAKGAHAIDEDGNRYLDFCMAWGPLDPRPCASARRRGRAARRHRRPRVRHGASRRGRTRRARARGISLREAGALRRQRHRGRRDGGAHRARVSNGRRRILKFDGCYHGHVDSLMVKAGSGVITQGLADSAGVPAQVAADTLVMPARRRRRARAGVQRAGQGHRRRHHRAAAGEQRPAAAIAANICRSCASSRARMARCSSSTR